MKKITDGFDLNNRENKIARKDLKDSKTPKTSKSSKDKRSEEFLVHLGDTILRKTRMKKVISRFMPEGKHLEKSDGKLWEKRVGLWVLCFVGVILFLMLYYAKSGGESLIVKEDSIKNTGGEASFAFRAENGKESWDEKMTLDLAEPETGEEEEQGPSERELASEAIRNAIETAVDKQKKQGKDETETFYKLPTQVDSYKISYRDIEKKADLTGILLGAGVLILIPFVWWQKKREENRKRLEEMEKVYPEFIHKFVLLYGAGMMVKGCIQRITRDYESKKKQEKYPYFYREISLLMRDLQNGVTETRAVEDFGKRCTFHGYLRFSSILSQTITKGSDGVIDLLEQEVREAYEMKKESVRKMSETASTKLLLPLVMMLAVVMAMILIPAFMTM